MLRNLLNDECGAVISAELVLVLTIAVIGLIVGLSEVAVAINTELNDISNALGKLDQSYFYTGFKSDDNFKQKSYVGGARFTDSVDDGDTNGSCDIVAGSAAILPNEGGY